MLIPFTSKIFITTNSLSEAIELSKAPFKDKEQVDESHTAIFKKMKGIDNLLRSIRTMGDLPDAVNYFFIYKVMVIINRCFKYILL